jgi:chromosome segregation ATPase
MRKEFVMGCIGKTVVRGVVITALAGGVLVAVAGPQRVSALVTQTRGGIQSAIDSNIQDPVLLRTQIRQLESEYPKKIAEVRSDLGEVQTQVAQLERERQVAEKVVQLAALDLEQVDAQLEQARATQLANPGAIVRVSFDSSRAVDLDDAYARRQQIEQTRDLYAGRARDLSTDLTYLVDQEAQLTDLLARLETEQSEFQAKLFQLDAQIDTIARNERMITMMEDRQATIDEHSRYQANSLDQLNGRLSQIRNEQRSRLESISRKEKGRDYVNEAEFLIERDGQTVETGKALPRPVIETTPKVIEIRPDTPSGKAQASSAL